MCVLLQRVYFVVCVFLFMHIHMFFDGEREEEVGTTEVRENVTIWRT